MQKFLEALKQSATWVFKNTAVVYTWCDQNKPHVVAIVMILTALAGAFHVAIPASVYAVEAALLGSAVHSSVKQNA